MPADPNARQLHLWTGLILLGVFLAGAATGVGVAFFLGAPPRLARTPHAAMLPPPLAELGLSPEQADKARAIFERYRPEIEAAVQETLPRVRAIQERAEGQVRALLTPEQAARFDAARARRPPLGGMGPGMVGPGMGPPGAPPPGPPPR